MTTIVHKNQYYYLIGQLFYFYGRNGIFDHMVEKTVVPKLLQKFDADFCEGYFARRITVEKVFIAGYYWPIMFRDIFNYYERYEACEAFTNKCIVNDNLYHTPSLGPFDKYDIDLMNYCRLLKGNIILLIF